MIALIYAHPYGRRSRANKALLTALEGLADLDIVDLYEQYPDFQIDAKAEQQRILAADTLIWQHPMHWYHTPALLSLWFEKVLAYGWAYGNDQQALKGKRVLWVSTTGGEQSAYDHRGYNHFPIDRISTPIHQTALFCGMEWLEPFTVFGAGKLSDAELLAQAELYRDRVVKESQHAR